jgi:hypothetical protein
MKLVKRNVIMTDQSNIDKCYLKFLQSNVPLTRPFLIYETVYFGCKCTLNYQVLI